MKKTLCFSMGFQRGTAVACLIFFLFFVNVQAFAQTSFGKVTSPLNGAALIKSMTTGPSQGQLRGQTSNQPSTTETGGSASSMLSGMDYQVHVLGRVQAPGTYRLGPSVRLAEALGMAGGVESGGSQRRVELRRGTEKPKRVDLLQFTRRGDLNANPFLQDNDVIFIPFVEQSVRIEGPVKSGGVYELVDERTVWDVVEMADGYTPGASDKGEVVIIRYDENEKKKLIKVKNIPAELKQVSVQGADIIVVPHIFTKDRQFNYAFSSFPSDNVFYPSHSDSVYVAGAVLQQGPQAYNASYGIREYVNQAGLSPLAKLKSVRILKGDGKIQRNIKKYSLSPGDTIIVPEKKMTSGNVLSWYSTFAGTVFTGVALKSLVDSYK